MISVLYVDDESTLLEITRIWLEQTGEFSVSTCPSAGNALELPGLHSFDAIISDYQMPHMDGIAFLRHLRDANNKVPFILFTGKGREEVAIAALNSGADFYLQKGGEPKSQFAELASKIRQAVQRHQAEQALAASEEQYRELVENINDVIYTVSPDGIISYISPVVSIFGYKPGDLVGRPIGDVIHADDLARVRERLEEIGHGDLRPFGFRIHDASGAIRHVRTSSRPVMAAGRFTGVHGVMTDITSQKEAEEKLSVSEQRYCNVFGAAGDALLVVDRDSGRILDANRSASALFGYLTPEFRDMRAFDLFAGGDAEAPVSEVAGIFGSRLRYYRRKDTSTFPASLITSEYPQENRTVSIHAIRDLTDEVRAEERVLAAQRLYAVLSQVNQAIARVQDLPSLLRQICEISVTLGRFRMAWMGLIDRDSETLRPVAWAGNEEGYLAATEDAGNQETRRQAPTGSAIHEGSAAICNDIGTDPCMAPWRDEALKRGYRSMAAIPIRLNGEVIGAWSIYAGKTDFFDTSEVSLLDEIATDISFALDRLDEQARRARAEKALTASHEKVRTLATILELSSQPFGIGHPDGRFGFVNPALCGLLGYTGEELKEQSWTGLTAPEFAEAERAALDEVVATGIPQRYEKVFVRKDGSRVPVEMFVHRVTGEDGTLRYFYAFVTDITERRKAKEEVRKERDRAQQYLDTAGVMLGVLDTNGSIALINRRGCAILGYDNESELLGRNWIDTCLPERVQDEVRAVFSGIASGEIAPFEYHENVVKRQDGAERLIAFHNTPLYADDGRITGILFSGEDITDRTVAEEALKQSEERFRSLIQNATDMIRIIGPDGLITYSSPSTLRITGTPPAEFIGKNPMDYLHPDDRDRVKAALAEVVLRQNSGIPTGFRIRHADGSYIDVESVATNLADMPGISGVVTTTRPIGERRKAERELRESEWRYRAIFEKSADAILVLDDVFTDCNPQAERLFGCARDDLIGRSPLAFSPPEQRGGRPSAEVAAEQVRAARQGAARTFGWIHCRADGRTFPAEVTLIPATVDGTERLIAIVRDTSAKDAAERHAQHLARFPELNPDPVIEVRRDRGIVYANPAARRILRDLGMPEDPQAYLPEDFDAVVIAIQAETSPSIRRILRIGTAIFCETLSFDAESSTIRIFAHDITTRTFEKNALEQVNHKLNLLSHITRHDIKNKLTGVLGYLELAHGSTRDPELIEYISRAEISANAVRQQIEFTKEYENLGVKAPAWQDVSGSIARALQLVDRGSVVVEDECAGLLVYADPMFEKVIYCLIENALVHGKTLTRIRLHGERTPTGYLLLVENDGEGITPEQKEKIFTRKVGKEAGIGLFLSREVLSITGMTIEENAAPGEGVRFAITIPAGKYRIHVPE